MAFPSALETICSLQKLEAGGGHLTYPSLPAKSLSSFLSSLSSSFLSWAFFRFSDRSCLLFPFFSLLRQSNMSELFLSLSFSFFLSLLTPSSLDPPPLVEKHWYWLQTLGIQVQHGEDLPAQATGEGGEGGEGGWLLNMKAKSWIRKAML